MGRPGAGRRGRASARSRSTLRRAATEPGGRSSPRTATANSLTSSTRSRRRRGTGSSSAWPRRGTSKDLEGLKHVKGLLVEKANAADAQAEQEAREAAERAAPSSVEDQSAAALERTPTEVIAGAEAFLNNPNMMRELAEDFQKLGVAGE